MRQHPSQVPERYRTAMSQITALIRERGEVPAQLAAHVDAAIALWDTPAPDLDIRSRIKKTGPSGLLSH